MSLVELVEQLRHQQIHIYLEQDKLKYRAPKGALTEPLMTALRQHKDGLKALLSDASETPQIEHHPASRYEPFALTELQHAYWVGEQGIYRQATTPYFYFEYDLPEQPLEHFATAIEALIRRHDAFRLQVSQDALQRILPFQGKINAELMDLREASPQEKEDWLSAPRKDIQSLLPSLESGQPYFFRVGRIKGSCRLFLGLRLHMIDGPSVRIIFRDFLQYLQQAASLDVRTVEPLTLSFRDYVLARQNLSKKRQDTDQRYWLSRLDSLPLAPQLPQAKTALSENRPTSFQRLSGCFKPQQWHSLENGARRYGVSANAVLCQLFADVLCQWTQEAAFSLNMLASQRPFDDPDMPDMIGNCGSTLIVQCDNDAASFAHRCQVLHKQMLSDFAHSSYSGVSVIQALQSQRVTGDSPVMPVVFTSGIQSSAEHKASASDSLLSKVFSKVHTPQVWLDHQVVMEQGQVHYYWDFVDDVFPDKLIPCMFNLYQRQIERLCAIQDWTTISDAWHLPDHNGIHTPPDDPCSDSHNAHDHLLSGFLDQVRQNPDRQALITEQQSWNYQQLLDAAHTLAAHLQEQGVENNDPVALCIEKGPQQVIAILATLLAGAFYIPIDQSQPAQRRNQILEQSGCQWLLVHADSVSDLPQGVSVVDIKQRHHKAEYRTVDFSPEATAYVIFTSGSTGTPKGVEMKHSAVLNTLIDVSERFSLSADDRVIALSAYNFDLSVFDIFATLAAGAAIVMPTDQDRPDPEHWLDLCQQHKVTVWNSVPALMEMAWQMASESQRQQAFQSLRLIMFSGDWIPLLQARQILSELPDTLFYSLGGATEAAIWSNYFPVTRIDPAWRSIPYGYSLNNQKLWVLDKQLRPCQPWNHGEIFIAGDGLANGYYRDDVRTQQSFIRHPETGVRLYRTGDLGCYQPSGCIDILGRVDFQIKLNGYRIELGEIEAVLDDCPEVHQACSLLIDNSLVAFVVPEFVVLEKVDSKTQHDDSAVRHTLQETLQARLPQYMVPGRIHLVPSLPVTTNGKWDRQQMLHMDRALKQEDMAQQQTACDKPITDPVMTKLAQLWLQVLDLPASDVDYLKADSHFFTLGGNSLSAVRLANRIAEHFNQRFPLSVFYQHDTLEKQTQWLKQQDTHPEYENDPEYRDNPEKVIFQSGESTGPLLVLFHPVGGSLLCYQSLYQSLPEHWQVLGFQSTENSSDQLSERISLWLEQLQTELQHTSQVLLFGWSMGGILACEMALRLKQHSQSPESVSVITLDSWMSDNGPETFDETSSLWNGFVFDISMGTLNSQGIADIKALTMHLSDEWSEEVIRHRWEQYQNNARALSHHRLLMDSNIHHIRFDAAYCQGFKGLTRINSVKATAVYQTDHFGIIAHPFINEIRNGLKELVTKKQSTTNLK